MQQNLTSFFSLVRQAFSSQVTLVEIKALFALCSQTLSGLSDVIYLQRTFFFVCLLSRRFMQYFSLNLLLEKAIAIIMNLLQPILGERVYFSAAKLFLIALEILKVMMNFFRNPIHDC